jgi:hypothetical protein
MCLTQPPEILLLLALCSSSTQSIIENADTATTKLHSLCGGIRDALENKEMDPAELSNLMATAEGESRAARALAGRSGEELKKKEASVHISKVQWRSKAQEAQRIREVALRKEADAARARVVADKAQEDAAALEAEHMAKVLEAKDMKDHTARLVEQSRQADLELASLRSRLKDLSVSTRRLTAARGLRNANRMTSAGAIPLRPGGALATEPKHLTAKKGVATAASQLQSSKDEQGFAGNKTLNSRPAPNTGGDSGSITAHAHAGNDLGGNVHELQDMLSIKKAGKYDSSPPVGTPYQ